MGLVGIGRDGMVWDGMAWDGMGRDGISLWRNPPSNCLTV